MKQSVLSKSLTAAIGLLLCVACGGDDDPQPEPTYSVVAVKYIPEEGESIQLKTHESIERTYINKTGWSMTVHYTDSLFYSDLVLSSVFKFSPELPPYLGADTLTIPTPFSLEEDKVWATDRGFTLADWKQTVEYADGSSSSVDQEVPANCEATFQSSIKEELLSVDVELIMQNDLTGEQLTYTGKWAGTLGYTGSTTSTKIEAIN